MIYDCTQLDAELRAQNLRIHGCASTGRIDWIDPPTPAEQATAQAVLAAHDPGKRKREERAAKQRLLDLADKLESGTATNSELREALYKFIKRLVR